MVRYAGTPRRSIGLMSRDLQSDAECEDNLDVMEVLRQLAAEIAKVNRDSNNYFAQIEADGRVCRERIAELFDRVETVSNRITAATDALNQTVNCMSVFDATIAELTGRIKNLEERVGNLSDRVSGLGERSGILGDHFSELSNQIRTGTWNQSLLNSSSSLPEARDMALSSPLRTRKFAMPSMHNSQALQIPNASLMKGLDRDHTNPPLYGNKLGPEMRHASSALGQLVLGHSVAERANSNSGLRDSLLNPVPALQPKLTPQKQKPARRPYRPSSGELKKDRVLRRLKRLKAIGGPPRPLPPTLPPRAENLARNFRDSAKYPRGFGSDDFSLSNAQQPERTISKLPGSQSQTSGRKRLLNETDLDVIDLEGEQSEDLPSTSHGDISMITSNQRTAIAGERMRQHQKTTVTVKGQTVRRTRSRSESPIRKSAVLEPPKDDNVEEEIDAWDMHLDQGEEGVLSPVRMPKNFRKSLEDSPPIDASREAVQNKNFSLIGGFTNGREELIDPEREFDDVAWNEEFSEDTKDDRIESSPPERLNTHLTLNALAELQREERQARCARNLTHSLSNGVDRTDEPPRIAKRPRPEDWIETRAMVTRADEMRKTLFQETGAEPKEVFDLYMKAGRRGSKEAIVKAADMLRSGTVSVKPNASRLEPKPLEALNMLTKVLEDNPKFSMAMNVLGDMWMLGQCGTVSKKKAYELFSRSADLGDNYGVYKIGSWYFDAMMSATSASRKKKNCKTALSYLKSAIEGNCGLAASMLGHMFEIACRSQAVRQVLLPNGTEEELHREVVNYYMKAMKLGAGVGYNNIAACYETGYGGLEPDFELAKKYYALAFEKGHVRAADNLALLLELGGRGKFREHIDSQAAVKWYELGYRARSPTATFHLGNTYEVGVHAPMNKLAAEALYKEAIQYAQEAESDPDSETIREAEDDLFGLYACQVLVDKDDGASWKQKLQNYCGKEKAEEKMSQMRQDLAVVVGPRGSQRVGPEIDETRDRLEQTLLQENYTMLTGTIAKARDALLTAIEEKRPSEELNPLCDELEHLVGRSNFGHLGIQLH